MLLAPTTDATPINRPTPPLEQYRQRVTRRRLTTWTSVLLVLAGVSWLDHRGWLLHPGTDWQRYHGVTARVTTVIDGDTLLVDLPDRGHGVTRIRLWGIDTPEVAKPHLNEPAEPLADAARERVITWCAGQPVTLELERHRTRGRFGRVLAHVVLSDGTVLNERLLAEGFARADPRFSHDRLDRYAHLERQARFDRIGLWRR